MTATYRYLPDTEQDQKEMLDLLNVSSIDELFEDIPAEIRLEGELNIPAAVPEPLLMKKMQQLSSQNKNANNYPMFLGAGTYDHYIPSVVDHMISRSEFYTAYTPYQPEISQGELQAIFEFQTMVSELTGMDVANSSMYDGFTSLAEAASLAVASTKRSKVLISKAVHPESRAIINPVSLGQGYTVEEVDLATDVTDLVKLQEQIGKDTSAVIVQYPNFFGSIEDLAEIKKIADAHGALLIVSANPLALALLQAPGKLGADIVIGDMQPLGIPMSFGGPHCGYFAVSKKFMRKIPGRIVGQTTDEQGKRGFVLTLQAREQHIRRDKATSNICSNQALNALASSICMTALGKQGVRHMAQLNFEKADYMAKRLQEKGFTIKNQSPFFNEFVVELPRPVKEVNEKALEAGIIGGYDLGIDYGFDNQMLIAVTEQRTKEEIDQFVKVLEDVVNG
ncbi:aminomethyl-transferring glycine dehydrogenase subunit GcvPA [Metabacillus sediminilitoris]|uniref:Probable glycine dehydrogenase (decarboxylating) subunit 1 n=1 Tax=Metabacillus sediminilitoris TaxID=2567941 RepID=A0A4V3WF17_9BACI|nr:aminomethyl-transferring glycine dehydrogenase subunit GcvPA [Metabacillus sediminilitoris]QGQ44866.1 aminomethyl-transferring glycine dehydrogenase subunit GcvPA [Metabacillus sediminilitoris]THF78499.1 aminomethyl-transferring glycine dehydrogenase subunit GcvPA [Metabacillus sediminilitoris]